MINCIKYVAIGFFSLSFFGNAISQSLEIEQTTEQEIDQKREPKTILQHEADAQASAETYPNLINLYNPTYVLPYYQTHQPYQSIYFNATPNNQLIKDDELKAYFSFVIPLMRHIYKEKPLSLNFAYSQLMFWQVYANSPYFRETNYEPELFVANHFSRYFSAQIGLNHQSNGRGGYLERSWNRGYGQVKFTGQHWLVRLRGWNLLAEKSSSNQHNPDIAHYLGYDNVVLSYTWKKLVVSVEAQNLESGFSRGFVNASLSYPILKSVSLFGQFFNGYGQSLIEYNHKTTGVGIGISLNNWINL